MVFIENPINEQMSKEIEEYQDEFKEVLEHISELRKSCKDTKIAEVMVLAIPPKFKMIKATWDSDDLLKLRKDLKDLKREVKSVEEGIPFEVMLESVHNVYVALYDKNKKMAIEEYGKLMELYKKLEPELKNLIYPVCVGLHKRIASKDIE